MALTNEQVELSAQVAKLLNQTIAGVRELESGSVFLGMTWDDVAALIANAQVEGALQDNIEEADALLKDAAAAFASFHTAAANVEVNPPDAETIAAFKAKLRELHAHVQASDRLEAAAKLAGSLADMIESEGA